MNSQVKVAIVHYWWLSNRGGESVVKSLVDLYPHADLYLHVCNERLVRQSLGEGFKGRIYTTYISRLPFAIRFYKNYLPFMPHALEQLDLSEYDIVFSSESGPAKGVITSPESIHICYCHSPMRYIWDMYHEYSRGLGFFAKMIFSHVSHYIRLWDVASANRVDYFVANSNFISRRIKKYYRRDSEVIYPPVDVDSFCCSRERKNFYLYLGQLVSYKKPDIAVQAFNHLNLPLIVIGEGELEGKLAEMGGANVKFLGRQSFDVVKDHLETCRGLIFPGVEDFGIVPVEAMASGAPVIAYGKGGVLDTVVDGETGLLFTEQSVASLVEAILRIENGQATFDVDVLRRRSYIFSKEKFQEKIINLVSRSFDVGSD